MAQLALPPPLNQIEPFRPSPTCNESECVTPLYRMWGGNSFYRISVTSDGHVSGAFLVGTGPFVGSESCPTVDWCATTTEPNEHAPIGGSRSAPARG